MCTQWQHLLSSVRLQRLPLITSSVSRFFLLPLSFCLHLFLLHFICRSLSHLPLLSLLLDFHSPSCSPHVSLSIYFIYRSFFQPVPASSFPPWGLDDQTLTLERYVVYINYYYLIWCSSSSSLNTINIHNTGGKSKWTPGFNTRPGSDNLQQPIKLSSGGLHVVDSLSEVSGTNCVCKLKYIFIVYIIYLNVYMHTLHVSPCGRVKKELDHTPFCL